MESDGMGSVSGTRVDLDGLRHHGDVDAVPGLLDFAVNIRGVAPPQWLRTRLAARLDDLAHYPSSADDLRARSQVAQRHHRHPDSVLPLAGAAEGFALLPTLRPQLAAVVHPSFTEPELALREAGIAVHRVLLPAPYELDPSQVPDEADLVVLGNPTNPTSVLHRREVVLALRRPGRIVVVDEAFADAVPGEPESLAGLDQPDVLVLRSLTKTWAIAGLRAGYFLGSPDVLARLTRGRAHWPLGTLQLEALAACNSRAAVAESEIAARELAQERAEMVAALTRIGVSVALPASGPFLLLRIADAERVRQYLRDGGIAVRRCDTFPGLGADHLRVAVRGRADVGRLVNALSAAGLELTRGEHAVTEVR